MFGKKNLIYMVLVHSTSHPNGPRWSPILLINILSVLNLSCQRTFRSLSMASTFGLHLFLKIYNSFKLKIQIILLSLPFHYPEKEPFDRFGFPQTIYHLGLSSPKTYLRSVATNCSQSKQLVENSLLIL